jgi:hypothetical protein
VASSAPFELGRIYNRQREIHDIYDGQRYGGIATPAKHPYVFIFSSDVGASFGYTDEELPDGGLIYYGEGQVGDMQMIKGNRAIRDHVASGRTLHLFREASSAYWQYAGEFECVGDDTRPNTPDRDGNVRTAIVFELRPVSADVGPQPELEDAVDAITAIARGRGFSQRLTAPDRKAIEMRAMQLATDHFAALGFDIENVSATQPYDLRCTKDGERIDVEVKGTTTAGETVLLTANEVQHALATHPYTALAITHSIALHGAGTADPAATGGIIVVHRPWRPLDTDLKAIGYTYTLPVTA